MVFSKKVLPLFSLTLLGLSSCSPLSTSPHDERHQWELKLHEVQTNLEDLSHDINCFQTEIQILDGRIKYYENALASLKNQDLEKQEIRIEQLVHQIQILEKKWSSFESMQNKDKKEIEELASQANQTVSALSQFKKRIQELEQKLLSQDRKFEEVSKLKGSLEKIAHSFYGTSKPYTVQPGDSLEKIAKAYQIEVDEIRKLNHLKKGSDLIYVGQELKIPIKN